MPDPRIERLVEEVLERGCTPEAACRDAPELLPAVRTRLEQFARVASELDRLFPNGLELPRIAGYEVRSVLGRGGVGIVYEAWHPRLERRVALKMLLAGEFAGADEVARFVREARLVAALRHPHIVEVHDAGDHEGRPYFTMELLEGGSLAAKLQGTPLPPREAADLVARLAAAVQVAHDRGIVHRDLKPANVLLASDGTPKVADFGLARRLDGQTGLTRSGASMGTPSYMAPEQARGDGRAVGPAADIYSLGALLYELLTGRPPFRADTRVETQLQVLQDDPVLPSRRNAAVPRELETICLQCLDKDPERRYPSAAALAGDLQRFLAGEPIRARRPGWLRRVAKWARRNPARAALLGAAMLLASTAAADLVWSGWQRASLVQAAEADLRQAEVQLRARDLDGARATLERTRGRLHGNGENALDARLRHVADALHLHDELARIRFARSSVVQRGFNDAAADADYQRAFERHHLGSVGDPPGRVAAAIAASPVRDALVVALDDWALCAGDAAREQWICAVARAADPDPWRDAVRDLAGGAGAGTGTGTGTGSGDTAGLVRLAETAVAHQPVPVLLLLAARLRSAGVDPVAFLRRVQSEHPGDFWVNLELALALDAREDPDAIGCYRAAMAVRPDSVAVLVNLGIALAVQQRPRESFDLYERALRLEPSSTMVHANYAAALFAADEFEPAVERARAALELDATMAPTLGLLGHALWKLGRYEAAQEATRRLLADLPQESPLRRPAEWRLADCASRLQLLERLPRLLDGSDRPADAAETAMFAELCKGRGQMLAAADLFTRAFALDPALADNHVLGYRAMAAAAAARLGDANDAGAALEASARAGWRARACDWLRAELATWSRVFAADASRRYDLRIRVRRLREDRAFAAYREPFAQWPEAEAEAWRAVWRDADALQLRLERAR